LAERELAKAPGTTPDGRESSVRSALEKARHLRLAGKADEANAIYEGLLGLYRDDPTAKGIVDEINREKGS
jgi:hypothetical protein